MASPVKLFQVELTARSIRDLNQIYDYIDADQSTAAFRWFNGLERAILTLEKNPARCALAPEGGRLRHLLFGRKPHVYRVIFRIDETRKTISVITIRHGARQALDVFDL